MTLYSASCFGGNVWRLIELMYAALRIFYGFCVRLCTAFLYIYGFCVRLCTDLANGVFLLHMYTALLLRRLCGFCVRKWILCKLSGFCVRIWIISCAICADVAYVYGLSSRCLIWTVSRDPILRVPPFLLSMQALVIFVQSLGSNLEGSVNFLVCTSCSLILDRLEDPILRVPLSSLSARSARDSPSYLASEVYCWS